MLSAFSTRSAEVCFSNIENFILSNKYCGSCHKWQREAGARGKPIRFIKLWAKCEPHNQIKHKFSICGGGKKPFLPARIGEKLSKYLKISRFEAKWVNLWMPSDTFFAPSVALDKAYERRNTVIYGEAARERKKVLNKLTMTFGWAAAGAEKAS